MIKCRVRGKVTYYSESSEKVSQRMNERELSDTVNWGKKLLNWDTASVKALGMFAWSKEHR